MTIMHLKKVVLYRYDQYYNMLIQGYNETFHNVHTKVMQNVYTRLIEVCSKRLNSTFSEKA